MNYFQLNCINFDIQATPPDRLILKGGPSFHAEKSPPLESGYDFRPD